MSGWNKNTNLPIRLGNTDFEEYFNDFHENSDLSLKSDIENMWLAVVVSGATIKEASDSAILPGSNNPIHVDLGDGIPRYEVKIRIKSRLLAAMDSLNPDLFFKNPFGLPSSERERLIRQHRVAYTESTTLLPPFGAEVVVQNFGGVYFIMSISGQTFTGTGGGSNPNVKDLPNYKPGKRRYGEVPQNMSAKLNEIALKYNLRPRKYTYNGKVAKWKGKEVLNGLPHSGSDILGFPDPTNWEKQGSGAGSMLVDYLPSFNAMAAAYKAELKEKLTCSAIRSFEQQLKNRRKSVPVSGGGIGGSGCKSVNSRGCDTAIPGNSNHGIGQAIDIRPYYKRRHYAVNPYAGNGWAINSQSIQFKWMMKHAYKVGFLGIKWAHLGQDGTMLSSQKYEPWHWEPITGRVIG